MLSASRKELIKELLLKLNVQADNLELFDEALTHPSFNFEQNLLDNKDYERLEFLGDSVLRLALSSILFDKYTNYDEGNLSKIRSFLVSDEFLSVIAKNGMFLPIFLWENNLQTVTVSSDKVSDGNRSFITCIIRSFWLAVIFSEVLRWALKIKNTHKAAIKARVNPAAAARIKGEEKDLIISQVLLFDNRYRKDDGGLKRQVRGQRHWRA